MQDLSRLRFITARLNSVSVTDLPRHASFLASSISSCSHILSTPRGDGRNRNDDTSLEVHKIKTRLGSLLRDKTPEGRFTAVVLIKATVEAGGREILQDCDAFLRGLLAILNRPDPVACKRLCLILITRILSLTLVREITTPILPSFITACARLASISQPHEQLQSAFRPNPFLDTVLQCLLELLPHHPSTFRPFVSKLEPNLARLIGDLSCPDRSSRLATSLFVSLYICAPGNTATAEWLNISNAAIRSAHQIGDQIFRAVIEDWTPAEGGHQVVSASGSLAEIPCSQESPLHLPPWRGVHDGSRVLSRVISLLGTLVEKKTSCLVDLPLGQVLDLTSRLLSLRYPSKTKAEAGGLQFNPEVFQDERDKLSAVVAKIHESALKLLLQMVRALGLGMMPASQTLFNQLTGAFDGQNSTVELRLVAYALTEKVLELSGPSMTKQDFKTITPIVQSCCNDVDFHKMQEVAAEAQMTTTINGNADSFLEKSKKPSLVVNTNTPISSAASTLLCVILRNVPSQSIPHSIRTQIDRLSIINGYTSTMLASVLNSPSTSGGKGVMPSIYPFLARASKGEVEVEGLLRPRVPINVIQTADVIDDDEMDEDEDVDMNGFTNHQTSASHFEAEQTGGLGFPETQQNGLDRIKVSASLEIKPSPESSIQRRELRSDRAAVSQNPQQNIIRGTPELGNLPDLKRPYDEINLSKPESPKRVRNISPMSKTSAISQAIVIDDEVDDADATLNSNFPRPEQDKGKGKVIDGSSSVPQDAKATKAADSDDDSDFEMPPIYLKTDSEEDEDDDDGDDDDDAGDEGSKAKDEYEKGTAEYDAQMAV